MRLHDARRISQITREKTHLEQETSTHNENR